MTARVPSTSISLAAALSRSRLHIDGETDGGGLSGPRYNSKGVKHELHRERRLREREHGGRAGEERRRGGRRIRVRGVTASPRIFDSKGPGLNGLGFPRVRGTHQALLGAHGGPRTSFRLTQSFRTTFPPLLSCVWMNVADWQATRAPLSGSTGPTNAGPMGTPPSAPVPSTPVSLGVLDAIDRNVPPAVPLERGPVPTAVPGA